MKKPKLKPWQENERRWFEPIWKAGQYCRNYNPVKYVSECTGWSIPTVRAKVLQYGLNAK